ncbi:uncharacterized protein TNCV_3535911 [Trichonephila clavipes]|uniref:Reverse transcriptase domain-containing protein n=1 Tax=Trichonephila clavipes TaxID=2585209 RepID=A0A8X6VWD8_TRICX|nr:uncharacterized protein TNCV_3535911 [Trichonephila clavipes]
MDIFKLNKAKTSLKGSITRIATFMDNVSKDVDMTELEVKLKKIDQLQRKIEELKELLFGLETAKPTEEAEFEEDLYKWETRLGDLEAKSSFNILGYSSGFSSNLLGGPFLLAATIKYHIENYNEIHTITVQHLDSFMYVDDWITEQNTREEALFMSRHAKNIMKEAGMEMRKWINNDTTLMAQWAAEGFDTYPMDASISSGTNKTKVLGMAWQTLDDCLTLDTKGLLDSFRQTKIQKWLIWCKELPLLDRLKIPRLVLDSTNNAISDLIEIHILCDESKLAYGAAAYVKVRKQNEVLVNLITSKTRVAPLKAVTLPRLELLGALVAARLSSRVQEIVRKKKECKVFHWTDSKIVLFWIKGSSKRWKQFVANRVQEISK